mgnify:CR=1 FL=1|tara:strand:- start:526 stop:1230 length:705 start_codon:yes stop_codon:yes gene_type:complete
MARISSYPYDTVVTDNDAWIGTESSNRQTKQFTASAVATYLNINAKVNIGGQMSFKWSDTQNGGIGTISKTGGGGSGAVFNTLTSIRLSATELNGQNVIKFVEYIIGKPILIGQGDQISQFGHYTLDTYVVDPADPLYYIATLTFIGGNGVVAEQGTQYTIIHFNISGGAGSSVRQNFGTLNQWVINNTTGKATPSVTLVNAQEEVIHGCVDYTNATTITVDFDIAITGSSFLN